MNPDILKGHNHVDHQRRHQKFGDTWTEIHPFIVQELIIYDKDDRVVKTIKMVEVDR